MKITEGLLRGSILSVLGVWLAFFSQIPILEAGELQAGYAQRDITPRSSLPLWGYGKTNRPVSLAQGVHDPLMARALVLDSGASRLAIVTLDLGRAPREPMVERIRKTVRLEANVDWILLTASHTHHAPALDFDPEWLAKRQTLEGPGGEQFSTADLNTYYMRLESTIVEAVVEAAKQSQPVRLGIGSADSDLNRNRHSKLQPDLRDPELKVLRLDRVSGEPWLALVNFAAHPTIHPPQAQGYSADFPGVMTREVESAVGVHCMFVQGAAGDMQCAIKDDQWGTRDFIEPIGRALAEQVLAVFHTIQTESVEQALIKGITQRFDFGSRIDFTDPALQAAYGEEFGPVLVATTFAKYSDNRIRPHLATVLLNNTIGFVGVSGEFFCAHGLRLKERWPGELFFVGYCNGHDFYFPTVEAAAEGGYGADTRVAWIETGAGEAMMTQALKNLYMLSNSLVAPAPLAAEQYGTASIGKE